MRINNGEPTTWIRRLLLPLVGKRASKVAALNSKGATFRLSKRTRNNLGSLRHGLMMVLNASYLTKADSLLGARV